MNKIEEYTQIYPVVCLLIVFMSLQFIVYLQIPCYYTDGQRRAMLDAVSMAGLNCLRLMNDTTAGRCNYSYSFHMYQHNYFIFMYSKLLWLTVSSVATLMQNSWAIDSFYREVLIMNYKFIDYLGQKNGCFAVTVASGGLATFT